MKHSIDINQYMLSRNVVRGGSRIRNLLTHALNEFPDAKSVVWTGFGQPVGKAVTCAELMKREYQNKLYQITKLCYKRVEEYWDPVNPELDQLVVKKNLPMIHVYLSLEPLENEELGYGLIIYVINNNNNNPLFPNRRLQ
ncbi:hypothetical protein Zmor_018315 [Zophobas morio]|uniref:DNA/RNA-binding protein Alba-like domain-containing protein n=1 Tax=Zophobas morio TaxID=2755281 RepID=A0AA38MCW9_9CUCU|nr:hypothetical protein Zmor_018315 [Zophobas morio]